MPRVRRPPQPSIRLPQLRVLRVGQVRVAEPDQLSLAVGPSPGRSRELTVLDERERGTRMDDAAVYPADARHAADTDVTTRR